MSSDINKIQHLDIEDRFDAYYNYFLKIIIVENQTLQINNFFDILINKHAKQDQYTHDYIIDNLIPKCIKQQHIQCNWY